ncbi:hypothetical protein KUM42_08595 [Modestobacter sp. L9-4]|uniref:hypothetical protein n=1 Tax=Modestobacter sp. L9-4 TaxID=2851567 RepID=UPI001C78AFB6|nr:hypothetical protein [Modestobacter sp. L9-4]QXG77542.1 hypothetical protein KUM42_08595 [Modestobacter sp. L9-4]
MVEGRARLQAARWVVAVGRVTTALLVLGAIGASLVTWATWSAGPALTMLLYVGLASGWHALLTAFDRHGRPAWVLLVLWSATGAAARLGGWVLGQDVGLLGLAGGALEAVLLGLLLHPDSREWVARPPAADGGRSGPDGSPTTVGMPHDHRGRHAQATEELP